MILYMKKDKIFKLKKAFAIMEEDTKRLRSCCFTGHRPEKLTKSKTELIALLEKAVDRAISNGYRTFITGMARGTDIWAANIVLERKKYNPEIKLVCAVPFPGFEKRRSPSERREYNEIITRSDEVSTICKNFSAYCFQMRNIWMVDHSGFVIAVCSGVPSGTKNTIKYAERCGIGVENILE